MLHFWIDLATWGHLHELFPCNHTSVEGLSEDSQRDHFRWEEWQHHTGGVCFWKSTKEVHQEWYDQMTWPKEFWKFQKEDLCKDTEENFHPHTTHKQLRGRLPLMRTGSGKASAVGVILFSSEHYLLHRYIITCISPGICKAMPEVFIFVSCQRSPSLFIRWSSWVSLIQSSGPRPQQYRKLDKIFCIGPIGGIMHNIVTIITSDRQFI